MTHLHKPTSTQHIASVSDATYPASTSIFFAEGGGDSKVKVSLPKMNLKTGVIRLEAEDPTLIPGWDFQVKAPPMSYHQDAAVLGWLPTIPPAPEGSFSQNLVSTREMRSVMPLPVALELCIRWEDFSDAEENNHEPKIKRFKVRFHATLSRVKQDPSGNVLFHLSTLEHPQSVMSYSGDFPIFICDDLGVEPRLTMVLALASISASCDFEVFAATDTGSGA